MIRPQKLLPYNWDDPDHDGRAPAMARCQAYGYLSKKDYIEYQIIGTDTGQSDESGELLVKYFCKKIEELHGENGFDIWWRNETPIKLYVNKQGEAYRSWKGLLKGRPVCNFLTGRVYSYR